jgi:hypothetical protein
VLRGYDVNLLPVVAVDNVFFFSLLVVLLVIKIPRTHEREAEEY